LTQLDRTTQRDDVLELQNGTPIIEAVREQSTDYDETARLATEAFGSPSVHFTPEHLKWFYERCFSLGSVVVALRRGGCKIGQCTLVRQSVRMGDTVEEAVQLVDLFIQQEHRSRAKLQMLYDEVERQCRTLDVRFAIGMPNAKAVRTNEHFFKLRPYLWLQERFGLALPWTARGIESTVFDATRKAELIARLSRYRTADDDNGLRWDAARLYDRLCGFKYAYGLHMSERALLISSPRRFRNVNYTLLCGFVGVPGATIARPEMRCLIRAACRTWRKPLFVYAGLNRQLAAMPGLAIPRRVRPSLMLMQLRDFKPDKTPVAFDHFQLIDFDFA
jgi:hypothetical protein